MKFIPTMMLVLLAQQATFAIAAAPELYVRGGFNGWGTDHALKHTSQNVYEAQIMLSPGNHPFKIGSGDWSVEWVIDPAASVTVAPGSAYPLATRPGPEDFLFVRSSAPYRFRLDVNDPARPLLRVTRLAVPQVALPDPHQDHATSLTRQFATFDGKQETVRFSTPDASAALRTYAQSSTMQLRDPGPQHVTYRENAGLPVVRTGNLAFDALFALAGAEMKQASVAQIKDGNYNGGAIACDCFETGEKWHYVWTRDLSYAADLGLAMLDPERVRNSLDFKLSPWRAGMPRAPQVAGSADGLQIIQDTGSGGSWPVSTDRVSWAFGAARVLDALAPTQRKAFAPRALAALSNTLENDRLAAFDVSTGLYQGEQSFLDWRDQTYAAWIVNDLASMATSRALSTNVAHYRALTLAATLAAEQRQPAMASRYAGWARQLKQAINDRLWLKDAGMYSSLTAGHFDGAPMHKFDWLGQSLAILTGVADPAQARQIMARYPHGPMGAPVIYPQQQDLPVYHNRAIWPFVTAYGLKAAAVAGNVSVADAAYDTLMRAASLNLSNMENLEWLSGQPLLLDERNPALIGPVINSKRQLWSVGGYLGMVIGDVFGIAPDSRGIELRPFITAKLRREAFAGASVIRLDGLRMHGKRISVRIHLPAPESGNGYYPVATIEAAGKPSAATIPWNRLAADSVIDIRLGKLVPGEQSITRVSADPYEESPAVFGPREPAIANLVRGSAGAATMNIVAARGAEPASYNVYRDGVLAASGLEPGPWTDTGGTAASCYAAEALFTRSGNRSHHSVPACAGVALEAPVRKQTAWGKPGETFSTNAIRVTNPGTYAVQVRYHNGANQINLGISAGVKWMAVRDAAGRVMAQGVVQLPHARIEKPVSPLVYSTPLQVTLAAGAYTVTLSDFYNMSYLQANSTFSAAGGVKGPSNSFDIDGVRLLPVSAPPLPSGQVVIVNDFVSPQLSNSRKLRIFLPPSYSRNQTRRYPVLYMHDGQNLFDARTASYGTEWGIDETVDRLVRQGAVEEVIVVGIDNTPDRIAEYTPCCDPKHGGGKLGAYQAFIVDTVKPYVDRTWRTRPGRESTAIMGSSLGGIASFLIAQNKPDVFSMAGGVSSSFWWNQGAMISAPAARVPVRFYLDAGTDKDGLEDTTKVRDAMLAQGYRHGADLFYHVGQGASHNEKSWAARVDNPLVWFFPKR